MALAPCVECGNQISDKAATCPRCGAPVTAAMSAKAPHLATKTVAGPGLGGIYTATVTCPCGWAEDISDKRMSQVQRLADESIRRHWFRFYPHTAFGKVPGKPLGITLLLRLGLFLIGVGMLIGLIGRWHAESVESNRALNCIATLCDPEPVSDAYMGWAGLAATLGVIFLIAWVIARAVNGPEGR